ncbi:hypothetical protein Ais01nite_39920 [Asanoa ishikariensis]|uniref:DUF4386 family protein n=1 Tax=Asanoa ishikariensis TaxID=137265 RepID=A0A1H3M7D1_9ACTN|nr:hypothetical protein [Asanoa ishikariensis]GIF65957.1 hypothetical protein Ais01nite_39920 [Asanoa ishikariensis]SDY72513.1 hypothetical protein SAMN05421684_1229 [Asanoa ishikariensis]
MSEAATRRTAGTFGILASLFIVAQVPLYFLYETPPDWDILTRSLVGITGCTLYLVFFAGLRQLIRTVDPRAEWLASLIQVAGALWVVMVFVTQSMEAGAAISVDRDIDTTTEGPFAAAQYLMQGGISRLLMALLLVALGIAVGRLRFLPKWVGRSAYVLAVINLAFVPAVFFGDDAADFYSAQGWGTTASMGALWSLWTLAISVSILRSASRAEAAARHTSRPEVPAYA